MASPEEERVRRAAATAGGGSGARGAPGSPWPPLAKAKSAPGSPVPSDNTTLDSIPTPAGALEERYELLAEVGRGGMGVVYRARDRETGEIIAVKLLTPEIAARPDLIERFKSEVRLARKITHKHACRIHELLRFGGTWAISMEYVEGETLRDVLQRFGSASIARGIEWAREICGVLAEAHAQGIVHRDLKPENIIIDRTGHAKVMDFGIARSIDASTTQTGAVIGTPAYMSPEQAEGKPADARSDLYCLGLVLYEMFTGRVAFQAETPVAVVMKQIHETPPPPAEVDPFLPAFLGRAIEKCLEKDPAKRPQTVAELQALLAKEGEEKAAAAESAEQPAEIVLPARLARWQKTDWVLLAAALVLGTVFFALFDRVLPSAFPRHPMSRSEAMSRTRAIADKYAAATSGADYRARYDYMAYWPGFPAALEREGLNGVRRLWGSNASQWTITATGTAASFDNDGRLANLLLLPANAERAELPSPETLKIASQMAEELFGVRSAELRPEPLQYDPGRRCWIGNDGTVYPAKAGTPFIWSLTAPAASSGRITVRLQGNRLASASATFGAAPRRASPYRGGVAAWQTLGSWGIPALFVYAASCLLACLLRRDYLHSHRTAWMLTGTVTGLVAACAVAMSIEEPASFFHFVLLAFVLAAITAGISQGLLLFAVRYMRRSCPIAMKSIDDWARFGMKAHDAGLAVVRGTCLGACYLGVHMGLTYALGNLRFAAAQDLLVLFLDKGFGFFAVFFSFATAIGVPGMLVGVPLAIARRAGARSWPGIVATCVLWLLLTFSLPGAQVFAPGYPFVILQAAFLAVVFVRYDLLTCISCVLAIETAVLCYPLLRLPEGLVSSARLVFLFPWALVLLFALVTWGSSRFAAAYRRAVSVLD